jgi:hypothetical protein
MLAYMGAIKDLFESERGLMAVVLAVAATVLMVLNRMSIDQWTTFEQWVFGVYVAGKTITGATASIANRAPAPGSTTITGTVTTTEPAAPAPKAA